MYSHNTHGKLKILLLLLRELQKFSSKVFKNRMTVAQSADTCNDLQTETAGRKQVH